MDWRDLLTAFALYLVLEGALPFLNPAGFKRFLSSVRELDDATLRRIGLVSMAAGALLIYWVR